MKKRLFCLFLVLAMMAALLPTTVAAEEGHSHDLSVECGDDDPITFVEWDGSDMDDETDGIQLTEGSYYLADDVTVNDMITVVGQVDLCLNGKILRLQKPSMDDYMRVILIESDGELNLCECQTNVYEGYFHGENPEVVGAWKELADGQSVPSGHSAANLVGGIIMGGSNHDLGGALYNAGTFRMYGGNIANNYTYGNGGAVYNEGEFDLYGGTISGNAAKPASNEGTLGKGGGGVYSTGTFNMYGGVIVGNSGRGCGGGGVYNTGTFTMYDGTVDNNGAGAFGGGVANDNVFDMEGGNITRNLIVNGSSKGGGVYNGGTFTMTGGTIGGEGCGNLSKQGSGGGVHNDGTFILSGGSITYNEADTLGDGGGGVCNYGDFTMTGGTVSYNNAFSKAGGVYNNNPAYDSTYTSVFRLEGGTISHNETTYDGGGVYTSTRAVFEMTGGSISENKAEDGGGVFAYGTFTLSDGEITDNFATKTGGGVRVEVGNKVTVTGGRITDNLAGTNGGGMYVFSGAVYVKDSPYIAGNKLGTVDADGDVTVTDQANNVFLRKANSNTVLSLLEKLSDDASVGVSKEDLTKAFTTNWLTYMTGSTPVEYFFSDDDAYVPTLKSGELYLGQVIPATGVTLINCPEELAVGESVTLTAVVTPENCTDPVFWGTDDSDIATVENGVVTAKAEGIVAISVSVGLYGETCFVRIVNDHDHVWTYSAEGDTITAVCSGEGVCDATNLTLTLVKPARSRYDQSYSEKATVKDGVTSIGGVSTLPAIRYQQKVNGVYGALTETAPTAPGDYRAELTVEGVSAKVEYTIRKTPNNYMVKVFEISEIHFNGFKVTIHADDRSKALEYKLDSGKYEDVVLDADGSFTVLYDDSHDDPSVTIRIREKGTEFKDVGTERPVTVRLPHRLTGRVLDRNGDPVEGAEVKLMFGADTVVSAVSGADGAFKLEKKDLYGNYALQATKDGVSSRTMVSMSSRIVEQDLYLEIGAVAPAAEPVIQTDLSTEEVVYTQYDTAAALTVSAAVTDNGTLSYQWYKNSDNSTDGASAIAGATGRSYVPSTETVGTDYYFCVVTNTKANTEPVSKVSKVAKITVKEPAPATYEVSVVNGTGSGLYEEGATVAIEADDAPSGMQFKEWSGADGLTFVSGSTTTKKASFTMPAEAVSLTATYEDAPRRPSGSSKTNRCSEKCAVCGACTDRSCKEPACKDKCRYTGMNFTDVNGGAWYAEAVKYVHHRRLMNGVSETAFDPNGAMTRAMVVTILWNMEGKPLSGNRMTFADVADSAWYTEAVRWAADENLVEGWNGKFNPMDEISREQLAAILWRYAKYRSYDVSVGEDTNILSYEDAFGISEYAIPAVQWACGAGLMQGSGNSLMPKDGATRAQTAMLIYAFCENVIR